jgi:hypothetical protein
LDEVILYVIGHPAWLQKAMQRRPTTAKNIKTTERYLHVSKKDLVNIVSPLDDLWRKGKVDW